MPRKPRTKTTEEKPKTERISCCKEAEKKQELVKNWRAMKAYKS